MKRSNQKAFTFIEVIVVIVILGIISAVAVPRFFDLSTDAKIASSEGMIGAFNSACSIAFAKHRASNLSASGKEDSQYISDPETLAYYLDGGLPANVTVSGKEILLQDGRKVSITAETNKNRAKIVIAK